MLGNDSKMPIDNVGSNALNIAVKFSLKNLLHVPKASLNLISANKLYHDNNIFVEFFPHGFFIKYLISKEVRLKGVIGKRLYACNSRVYIFYRR